MPGFWPCTRDLITSNGVLIDVAMKPPVVPAMNELRVVSCGVYGINKRILFHNLRFGQGLFKGGDDSKISAIPNRMPPHGCFQPSSKPTHTYPHQCKGNNLVELKSSTKLTFCDKDLFYNIKGITI